MAWTANILSVADNADLAIVHVEFVNGSERVLAKFTSAAPDVEWPTNVIAAKLASLEQVTDAKARVRSGPVAAPAPRMPTPSELAKQALVEAQRAHDTQKLLVNAGAAAPSTLVPLVTALKAAAVAAGKTV